MRDEIKPKISVIGFGWASLGFLNNINYNKYDVEMYSKNRYFNYTPFLAKSITNKKYDNFLQQDINYHKNLQYFAHNVKDVILEENSIILENDKKYNYQYLVLSCGSIINYYNINGLEKFSYKLKSKNDILKIRKKLENSPNNTRVAVMGCGPTGVEVLGSLMDENKYNLIAIDALKRPVSIFDEKMSNQVLDMWTKKFHILMNSLVKK